MRSGKITTYLLLFTLLAATFEACQKDQTTPAAPDRDKFLGTWYTQSNGTSPPLNFTMTISAGSSSASQVLISNFDAEGPGTTVFGDVSGNSVSLTKTVIASDTITGSGTYNSNNTLSFSYTIRDGQTVDVRTASAHK